MMHSSRFSISLHILTLLALYPDEWQSSSSIASSININAVSVRKEVAVLKSGNLIESKEGKKGGIRLLKKDKEIYLSEIFKLIKGKEHVLSFSSNEPDLSCRVGNQINKNLITIMTSIDNSILQELRKYTLEDFKNKF